LFLIPCIIPLFFAPFVVLWLYLRKQQNFKQILMDYIDQENQEYRAILPDLIESTGKNLPENLNLTLEQAKKDLKQPNRKISKPIVSKVLKSLRKDRIVVRTNLEKDGRGPDPYEYNLINDFNALKSILEIFYDPKVDSSFSAILGSMFISSFYAQKMIPDLLKSVSKKMGFSLSEEEEKLILGILLSSPRAVLVALEYQELPDIRLPIEPAATLEAEYGNGVELFLVKLQLKMGEDILDLALPEGLKSFEYKITVSFAEDKLKKKYISKKTSENSIQSTILPKFSEDVYLNFLTDPNYSPL